MLSCNVKYLLVIYLIILFYLGIVQKRSINGNMRSEISLFLHN